jgi:hypothetical protein
MACWRRIPHFFDDSWGYHQENDDFKIKWLNFTKKMGSLNQPGAFTGRYIYMGIPLGFCQYQLGFTGVYGISGYLEV